MSVMGPAGMRRAGADDDGSCGGSDSEAANCDDPDCRSWNTPLTEDALSHFDNSAACRVLRTGAESLRADDSVLLSAEALQWLWASLVALDSLQAMQADVAHDLQFIRRKLERASTKPDGSPWPAEAQGLASGLAVIIRCYFKQR
eukprot:GHVU01210036.1.p4 GENE.GHVU01210036.1~~GHVU01210036.1.p4  ORF type:complete len:145 (-),score=22.06 GHVU01210036.1:501-935(-)